MENKIRRDLIQAREALKQKLRTLRADIAQSQRETNIQYAPIAKSLLEIASKLAPSNITRGRTDSTAASHEVEESWSDIIPEKSYVAIPGTSILRQNTPRKRPQRHVSWFSPSTHSSPTKQRSVYLTGTPQRETSFTTSPDVKRKSRLSETFSQPTFLEDEYIGELLPETPKGGDEEEERSDELDSSESLDLDKSRAHALSLLKTRPTKSIISNKSFNRTLLETDVVKTALKDHDPAVRPYLMGLMTDEKEEFDEKYGVREVDGDLMIGDAKVRFEGSNIIIGKFTYRATKGLLELLFKKKPGKFQYADAKNYKFILNDTNAARVDYDPTRKYAASKYYKYATIVKPIVQGKKPDVWWTRTWKTGLGLSKKLPLRKIVVPKSIVEYKHWNDVNELCGRLKLLVASKDAGHTGHDNEITSIIEELLEAKIIK